MLPKPSSRKHRMTGEKELQITAFLNLMVVLIPFLLITAVFARMTAIELTVPPETKTTSPKQQESRDTPPPVFSLVISIMEDEISIINIDTTLGAFKKDAKGFYDFHGMTKLLQNLKQEFPEEKSATILSSPSVQYKILVETIDAVREGFPDISLDEL
ncbi:MAG: hypothetical protein A3D21_06645 [Nitrospirae bacterium RIFCSPHIGHO2_02_FULL_42_12]|nr:MAG: hypothetical protein A3D21_06645 [Nitrospirae bacterium RIFCSPHIGHO2_02_FULL_42_12]